MCVCVCVCMHTPECACHRICVDFRGQCVGVNFLLCHVGHQARQKAPLHTELSHWSISRKFKRLFDCFKLKKNQDCKEKIQSNRYRQSTWYPSGWLHTETTVFPGMAHSILALFQTDINNIAPYMHYPFFSYVCGFQLTFDNPHRLYPF